MNRSNLSLPINKRQAENSKVLHRPRFPGKITLNSDAAQAPFQRLPQNNSPPLSNLRPIAPKSSPRLCYRWNQKDHQCLSTPSLERNHSWPPSHKSTPTVSTRKNPLDPAPPKAKHAPA